MSSHSTAYFLGEGILRSGSNLESMSAPRPEQYRLGCRLNPAPYPPCHVGFELLFQIFRALSIPMIAEPTALRQSALLAFRSFAYIDHLQHMHPSRRTDISACHAIRFPMMSISFTIFV